MNIITAGFKVPKNRKSHIDRSSVTNEDGTINHAKLVEKVNEFGQSIFRKPKRFGSRSL